MSAAPKPRRAVAAMHAYVPGEQPKDPRLIKLNTNENPYPPSPKVREALLAITDDRLRKYPDPLAVALRESIARALGVTVAQTIASNGSDEVLKLFVEAFVEEGEKVAYLWPTYSLYPVFAAKHAAREVRLPWKPGERSQEEALEAMPRDVKLAFVTSPNPPIGLAVAPETIRRLASDRPGTLFVVDEAYIAYGGESAVGLVREGLANVAVTRTFSKSHSLAGMRVGFALAAPEVVEMLHRVRDSYNLSVAAQEVARAAWEDEEWTAEKVARIRATREETAGRLRELGFGVEPSAGNFLFARREGAEPLYGALRERHLLVRYFDTPELGDGIRITIGTESEMEALLEALETLT